MIPNRHKTEQSGVGNFTVEHQQTQRQVGAALQVSGNTVIVASEQPGLTAYYVARILKQLSTMERNLAPRIRKLPADRDGILQALNERLADVDLANVGDAGALAKHRAREVWVYESLNSFKADGVCFGAKIIRQFKAAGISLFISVTPGETNAAALKKLMHNCKAQRWDFAPPTQKQCDDAMAAAAGTASMNAVQGVIRDMGMRADLQTGSAVLNFPKTAAQIEPSVDADLDVRQLLKAQRKQNKTHRTQAALATTEEQPRRRLALAQVAAGIVFIGTVVAVQFDLMPAWSDAEAAAASEAAVIDQSVAAAKLSNTPKPGATRDSGARAAVVSESSQTAAFSTQLAAVEAKSVKAVPATGADDVELMMLFADPEPVSASKSGSEAASAVTAIESAAKAPAAVSEAPIKPAGIFVQHGSFAQLQGARVLQNRLVDQMPTKIFMKGANPQRFVVVSGPFVDRQIARDTVKNGSDAFLVPAHLVGEEVMSLSGL